MTFLHQKNKGIAITLSAVIEGLFFVAVISLLYWFFWSSILKMHIIMQDATTERHSMNLANVLISSENLTYEKDGNIQRGVLDASKLDNIFIRKNEFPQGYQSPNMGSSHPPVPSLTSMMEQDIGIAYPNSINLVEITDLEICQNSICDGWVASLSGPINLEGLSVVNFVDCLGENFNTGALTLWYPQDIEKCIKNNIPASISSFFTQGPVSSNGIPVLIRYSNGELHIGKMIVGVVEFL
jgi:hypothetical protein